jgi:polyisoprenoid-binding protein YceI
MRHTLTALLLLLPLAAGADWTLEGDASKVGFITTKNEHFSERHRFQQVSGEVSGDGSFEVRIPVDSVDTGVGIRDERMRDILFKASEHPYITVRGDVGDAVLDLETGGVQRVDLEATVSIAGTERPLVLTARVTRLADDAVQVTSDSPVLVGAGQFGLEGAVDQLREVVGLSSISYAVPVYFSLSFARR